MFDPETNIGKDFPYRSRAKLIEALGLTELVDTRTPLLSEVMRLSKVSVFLSLLLTVLRDKIMRLSKVFVSLSLFKINVYSEIR